MDLVCLYLFVYFIFINDIFNMAFTFANLRSFISFPNEENILLKIIPPWKKNQQISEILHFLCHFLWDNISKCHVVENKESWRLRIQHPVMIQKMISLCYFKVSYSFLYLSTVRWSFKSHSIWLCSSTCLTCKQKSLTSLTHWCCPSVVQISEHESHFFYCILTLCVKRDDVLIILLWVVMFTILWFRLFSWVAFKIF